MGVGGVGGGGWVGGGWWWLVVVGGGWGHATVALAEFFAKLR